MKLNSIRYFLSGRRMLGWMCGIALLASIFACSSDYYQGEPESNGLLKLDAGMSSPSNFVVTPISDARLLLSYQGGTYDGKFSYEIYNINRQITTLTSQIQTGNWNLTLLSPQGAEAQIHNPQTGKAMAGQLMYEYKPVTPAGGNTPPAAEFLLGKVKLPPINADQTTVVNQAVMARNVAKVELFVDKASNIDLKGKQTVELIGVPSQLDWEGHLMPSKDNPTTLDPTVNPVVRTWKFTPLPGAEGGFKSDTLVFIVPAHRGSDFLNADGSLNANPTDVTTRLMNVKITITNSDGTIALEKIKPLPKAVNCNQVLRIAVKLSSLDFTYLKYDFTALPDWGGTLTSESTHLQ